MQCIFFVCVVIKFLNKRLPSNFVANPRMMPKLMVTSTTTGETRPVKDILIEFKGYEGEWAIEYGGGKMLRLLAAIEAILLSYNCTEVNALDLLLEIHGFRTSGVLWPVSYDGQANWEREQSMVAELLAAVFSVKDTKAKGARLVRLALTERSFSRIGPKTGATTTILDYADESANAQPAPSLSVLISNQGQGTPKKFEFVRDHSWMLRRYALVVS